MIRELLVAFTFICLITQTVCAQDEDGARLRISCANESSRLHLDAGSSTGPSSAHAQKTKTTTIDVASLVTTTNEDVHGDVMRTGSRTLTRHCGKLTLRIRDGYYNNNPLGEMGAADDYPIVELFEGTRRIAGPLAIGSCDTAVNRSSFLIACPDSWVTEVDVFYVGAKVRIRLKHDNQENGKPQNPTM